MAAFELDIWNGDWGLPSVDLHCLRVMTYAKFSGVPLKLNRTNNPWRSPTGELPVYRQRTSPVTLTSFESISAQLQNEKYNADFGLTEKQLSDIKAYEQWLQDKLLPGLLYTWWVDAKNYLDLSRPWFARALPFPLNYFVPGRRRKAAQNYLSSKYDLSEDEQLKLEHIVLKYSKECLNLLHERLEEKEFFFGRNPTSMDALIFAYLAPLLKVPFPNPVLQNHLKNCTNLVNFVDRILRRYFPSTTSSNAGDEQKKPTVKTATDAIDEFPNKYRNQFLAGFVAIVAMVGYAFTTGLVQVDISDELESEEVEDDEEDFQSFYEQQDNDHSD